MLQCTSCSSISVDNITAIFKLTVIMCLPVCILFPVSFPLLCVAGDTCRPPCDWMNKLSIRNTAGKHTRKVSLVFNHLEPAELAAQLTYLEFKALHRIQVSDVCVCVIGSIQVSVSLVVFR